MSGRVRLVLNLALWVAVLCMGAVFISAARTADEGQVAGGVSGRAGDSVGAGTVTTLAVADEEEQARVAEVLGAAEKMANAFINVRYDDIESAVATIRGLATGAFQRQYDESTDGLVRLITKAHTVMTGKVLWAGLVAGDDDSATVIVATTGTVENNATRSAQQRNYRLQVELALVDGQWLTRDLQFVA
jgi:Mce-associated membrane protein